MTSVAFITLAALVVVGILAVQANGSSQNAAANQPKAVTTSLSPSGATQVPVAVDPNAVPADSGSGQRLVYSIKAKQIWLVGSDDKAQLVATVVPGTVNPSPGSFKVLSRSNSLRSSDGLQVQYVVVFTHGSDGTSVGFDAVYGVSGMPPAPTKKTGGIRLTQDDARQVWSFTDIGSPVVVVP